MRSFDDFMTHFSNIFNRKIHKPNDFIVLGDKKSVLYESFKQCWHDDEDILFDIALRAVFNYLMLTPTGFGAITSLDLKKYVEKNIDAKALFDIGDAELEIQREGNNLKMCINGGQGGNETDDEDDETPLWDEDDNDDCSTDEISDEELNAYFNDDCDNTIEVIINGSNFSHSVLLMSSKDEDLIKMLTLCVIDGFTSNIKNPAAILSEISKAGRFNDLNDDDYNRVADFVKRISYVWHCKKYASVFDLIVDISELIILFGAASEFMSDSLVSTFFIDFEKFDCFWRTGLSLNDLPTTVILNG